MNDAISWVLFIGWAAMVVVTLRRRRGKPQPSDPLLSLRPERMDLSVPWETLQACAGAGRFTVASRDIAVLSDLGFVAVVVAITPEGRTALASHIAGSAK